MCSSSHRPSWARLSCGRSRSSRSRPRRRRPRRPRRGATSAEAAASTRRPSPATTTELPSHAEPCRGGTPLAASSLAGRPACAGAARAAWRTSKRRPDQIATSAPRVLCCRRTLQERRRRASRTLARPRSPAPSTSPLAAPASLCAASGPWRAAGRPPRSRRRRAPVQGKGRPRGMAATAAPPASRPKSWSPKGSGCTLSSRTRATSTSIASRRPWPAKRG
mmetsp:Transcript_60293/g.194154  ORF Transcript_60293/g.194154 Transcript_60293/m.194154 type:complete len:221 (-) Transcript_60293:326-988(-)